jgi:hypothetical protein
MSTRSRAATVLGRIKARAGGHPIASTLILVLVAYGLLTVVMTYPAALNLWKEVAGGVDVYPFMWLLWWAKRSLIDLHTSPANVVAFYHPYGVQLPSLLADANLMWTSLPLVTLLGPLVTYNVQLLTTYVLTAFTTYLLCYSLTKKHWPSFVGGVVFAFSAWRSGRAAHGGLGLVLTYWLPLYVMFLIRLFKKPTIRNGLFCGLFLALSVLSGFLHVAHFVIPVTVVFFLYYLFADRALLRSVRFWKSLGAAGGVAAALVIPVYAPLLQSWAAGGLGYFQRFGLLSHSASLLGLVVPPPSHPLAELVEPLRSLAQGLLPNYYDVMYLGIVALVLAACAGWNERTRVWVILAAVGAVLALGPLLRVGSEWVEFSISGRTGFVLMPGALLAMLPFYEWVRDPARFGELVTLSLAVLVCYGASMVSSRVARHRVARYALFGGMVTCILIDYSSFLPFPTTRIPIPRFYESLAADGDVYGVLDVGVGTRLVDFPSMYFQTVHQHPIAIGFSSRVPYEARHYRRFLEQLMEPQGDIANAGRLAPALQLLNLRYVVLHKSLDATGGGMEPFLAENLGQPVYEDDQIAAFAAPPTEPAGVVPDLPLVALGEQWHPIESVDGKPARWIVNDATLFVMVQRDGAYQLAFDAHPFREPRHLSIYVNEELIAEYHVGGKQSYVTLAFTLRAGEWTPVRLYVPEGCEVPSEVLEGAEDQRCLSMLFQALDVLPVEAGE